MNRLNIKILKNKIKLIKILKNKIKLETSKLFYKNKNLSQIEGLKSRVLILKKLDKQKLKNFCLVSGRYRGLINNISLSRHKANTDAILNLAQNLKINSW